MKIHVTFQIESVAFPGKCIDSLGHFYKEVGFYSCSHDRRYPHGSQFFFLGHHRDIEYYTDSAYCMEHGGSRLEIHACHHQQGSQYFRYDLDTQQIMIDPKGKKCLEADDASNKIQINKCNSSEQKQKWTWAKVYEDNLRNWENVGAEIIR